MISIASSVIPWFLVMRLIGRLDRSRVEAEALVEELRESRAAHAESAALAERSRMARDLHDVLAHSLSALALQLEGARLMATRPRVRPRGRRRRSSARTTWPPTVSPSRATRSPRCAARSFPGRSACAPSRRPIPGACELTVTGTPRELPSEARLAVYRTAQEALTNVLRHSAADRVELLLAYEPDAARLVVQDHGPGAPVAIGPGTPGGGYGLTGMRERAELLGGRLSAEPTADGFRVELWLPA